VACQIVPKPSPAFRRKYRYARFETARIALRAALQFDLKHPLFNGAMTIANAHAPCKARSTAAAFHNLVTVMVPFSIDVRTCPTANHDIYCGVSGLPTYRKTAISDSPTGLWFL
jgi:hypothetical protein